MNHKGRSPWLSSSHLTKTLSCEKRKTKKKKSGKIKKQKQKRKKVVITLFAFSHHHLSLTWLLQCQPPPHSPLSTNLCPKTHLLLIIHRSALLQTQFLNHFSFDRLSFYSQFTFWLPLLSFCCYFPPLMSKLHIFWYTTQFNINSSSIIVFSFCTWSLDLFCFNFPLCFLA